MKIQFLFTAAFAMLASPVAAQPTPAEPTAPAAVAPVQPEPQPVSPAAQTDLVQGAAVRGTDDQVVGTIEAVDAEGATIAGTAGRLRLPLNNFQKDAQGLRIGATRAQFDAAAQPTSPS